MIDHAPRLRAQQQQEQENAEIAELEARSMPLQWAIYAAVVIFALNVAFDSVLAHFERVADLAATNEAMVQCLKGKAIGLGDAVLRCDVREYQLVAGIAEVQP